MASGREAFCLSIHGMHLALQSLPDQAAMGLSRADQCRCRWRRIENGGGECALIFHREADHP